MRKHILLLIALGLFFASCKKDNVDDGNITERNPQLDIELRDALTKASDGVGLDHFILPESNDLQNIPHDPKNPLTKEKVTLGQLLFHETGLAINPMKELSKGTYACSSCHFASAGFQSGRHQAMAEGGIGFGVNGEGRQKGALYTNTEVDATPIRTPSAMNGAYSEVAFWNGMLGATGVNAGTEANWPTGSPLEANFTGYQGLEIQAITGFTAHRMGINDQFLSKYPVYRTYFEEAFPRTDFDDLYTVEKMSLAIAAYERTILSNQAPFQKWLRGDELALSDIEKEGAILFFGKAECGNCHNGPALNKMEFYAYGMNDLGDYPGDVIQLDPYMAALGRGGFTQNPDDLYKFKVPQLYNISDSPYYGHGASFRSIREVVEYKNRGVSQNPNVLASQLSEEFRPLNLSDNDIDAIVAFLEKGLRDPNLNRYTPESVPSGNCFPSNDPLAANELGCN